MRMKEGKNENKRANERTDLESLLFLFLTIEPFLCGVGTLEHRIIVLWSQSQEKERRKEAAINLCEAFLDWLKKPSITAERSNQSIDYESQLVSRVYFWH